MQLASPLPGGELSRIDRSRLGELLEPARTIRESQDELIGAMHSRRPRSRRTIRDLIDEYRRLLPSRGKGDPGFSIPRGRSVDPGFAVPGSYHRDPGFSPGSRRGPIEERDPFAPEEFEDPRLPARLPGMWPRGMPRPKKIPFIPKTLPGKKSPDDEMLQMFERRMMERMARQQEGLR